MTIHRSQERINKTGEVFTPAPLVKEMLDTLPPTLFQDPTKTFLDPAAGDGNFLVQVLQRKLDNGATIFQALHTTYGVELMPDNVAVCKSRLKDIALAHLKNTVVAHSGKVIDLNKVLSLIDRVLDHNIVCADSLKWDYDNWKPL